MAKIKSEHWLNTTSDMEIYVILVDSFRRCTIGCYGVLDLLLDFLIVIIIIITVIINILFLTFIITRFLNRNCSYEMIWSFSFFYSVSSFVLTWSTQPSLRVDALPQYYHLESFDYGDLKAKDVGPIAEVI